MSARAVSAPTKQHGLTCLHVVADSEQLISGIHPDEGSHQVVSRVGSRHRESRKDVTGGAVQVSSKHLANVFLEYSEGGPTIELDNEVPFACRHLIAGTDGRATLREVGGHANLGPEQDAGKPP